MTAEQCLVAVVGAGYTAREHIRAFQAVPGVSIAGIYSRTRVRAETLAIESHIPLICDSVPELFEKTGAHLVVITVPELAANAVSRACFEYPWTVLLEKPAGYNLADAEEIAAVAQSKNRRAFVALNRRFYSSTQAALDDLQTNPDKRFIQVFDQQDQGRALQAGQPQLVVDHWMYANSIHVVDYLRVFGRGKISRVDQVIRWNTNNPSEVVARVEFDSGDIGLYIGLWNGPGPWAVAIHTARRRWELKPLEQAIYQDAGERKLHLTELNSWDEDFKPGFRLQAEEAVAAAMGQTTRCVTLADALETMRLISRIFQI